MQQICNFSHKSKPHNLCRRESPKLQRCYVCEDKFKGDEDSFYCSTCELECHLGCYDFPREIQHPYHPSHSLILTSSNPDSKIFDIPLSWPNEDVTTPPDENLGGCKCCRRELQDKYYHCSSCKFSLNATCQLNPPPPTIDYPKIHEHAKFTLFPRRIPLPCDACGLLLDESSDHVYTCVSSNYIAHGKCLQDLPCVIKINWHHHRLSHTHSLPFPETHSLSPPGYFCGVCRKTVKVNYGQYSCTKGCHYAVHSKCATRKDVWDGKDLKGEYEEREEDIVPFKRIDEERLIHHFSHDEHNLTFSGEKHSLCDGSKFCQACLLLIVDSDTLYYCKECDFILHKACAFLPRNIGHPLHIHRLTLFPSPTNLYLIQFMVFVEGTFKCGGCHQRGYGFMYQCKKEGCRFQLDVRCANIAYQPFMHGSHEHPLFLSLTKGECMRCGSNQCSLFYVECTECKYFLGLKCATLPEASHYKYDTHPLTLCYGEKYATSGQYWCELCESRLDASEWFYTCNDCGVTLHVNCLLGKEVYMKPHHTIYINEDKVEIVRNEGNPRPFCYRCRDRCVDTLVFKSSGSKKDSDSLSKNGKKKDLDKKSDKYCCTLRCMQKLLDRENRNKKR